MVKFWPSLKTQRSWKWGESFLKQLFFSLSKRSSQTAMTSKAKRILYPLQIQCKVHFQMTISQIGILSDLSLDGAQTVHQFSNERKTSTGCFREITEEDEKRTAKYKKTIIQVVEVLWCFRSNLGSTKNLKKNLLPDNVQSNPNNFQAFFASSPNQAFTHWCRLGVGLVSLWYFSVTLTNTNKCRLSRAIN